MSLLPSISVIVPVLNEEASLARTLDPLQHLRIGKDELNLEVQNEFLGERLDIEIIVADGGSQDRSRDIALSLCDRLIDAPCGRARQMNAGAEVAKGSLMLFLHADTLLPRGWERAVSGALASDDAKGRKAIADWGRFDVRLDGRHPLLRIVERAMNLRSRLSGIATGDQAIFVRSEVFRALGGFPEIALMEDIAMSRMLKARSVPACLRKRVITSGRRWETKGVLRTIGLMWWLRLAYFFGADPKDLARIYRNG
ncbi:TIGR04283 family arsenosugar biosynthesis glycosyltransferase [Thioalkalivibrio sp. HK1]|uniref:TIGR04283 family arsenosugar biosynthesis glycosyltransferase n=1 Tax=Thioalkalivibrio sp. HK1 TaxID=1469245 RepID=UPI000472111C|nr:TIGR04283 family arsenosugar biosynthesis glycosyltransferase [Thioalkalivibrio sp. HK1]